MNLLAGEGSFHKDIFAFRSFFYSTNQKMNEKMLSIPNRETVWIQS